MQTTFTPLNRGALSATQRVRDELRERLHVPSIVITGDDCSGWVFPPLTPMQRAQQADMQARLRAGTLAPLPAVFGGQP